MITNTQKYALHQIVLQQKTLAEFGRSEAGFLWHFSCGMIVKLSCLLVDNSKSFLHYMLFYMKRLWLIQAYRVIIFITRLSTVHQLLCRKYVACSMGHSLAIILLFISWIKNKFTGAKSTVFAYIQFDA